MIISGFGGKGGSLSSRAAGALQVADRAGTKYSVVRAIAGDDLLVWIDASRTSNALESDLTNATINVVEGTEPVLGDHAPSTVFSDILNSTAYSFQTRESLKFNAGLFASNTSEVTIIARFCVTTVGSAHVLFELGNLNYFGIDGGIVLGALEGGTPETLRNWVGWGGQAPPDDDGDTYILTDQVEENVAYNIVATYKADVNPNKVELYKDGDITTVNDSRDFDGPDTANTLNKAYIGCRSGDGTPSVPLNGHISDFIVITRKLTSSEASRIALSLSKNHGGNFSTDAGDSGGGGVTWTIDSVAGQTLTEEGTLYNTNGPDGYYGTNENYTVNFQGPSGTRVRATLRNCQLDSWWGRGLRLQVPFAGDFDDPRVGENWGGGIIYGSQVGAGSPSGRFTNDGSLTRSPEWVLESSTNEGAITFTSDSSVRADGKWEIQIEFI